MMEFRFLSFALFALFVVFGSIEARRISSRRHFPRWFPRVRYTGAPPYRPFATVHPPRYQPGNCTTHHRGFNATRYPPCTGRSRSVGVRWNGTSPRRPFPTIPTSTFPADNYTKHHRGLNATRRQLICTEPWLKHRCRIPIFSRCRPGQTWPSHPTAVAHKPINGSAEPSPGPGLGYGHDNSSTRLYP